MSHVIAASNHHVYAHAIGTRRHHCSHEATSLSLCLFGRPWSDRVLPRPELCEEPATSRSPATWSANKEEVQW